MWGWGHGIGMVLWWIIGLAAIVAFVWVLVRMGRSRAEGTSSAEEMLRRRYAAGEIDEEEFRRRLSVLRGGRSEDTDKGGS